jgi:hypothetical protein
MSLFGISTIMLELKHISWPEMPLVYMSISDKNIYHHLFRLSSDLMHFSDATPLFKQLIIFQNSVFPLLLRYCTCFLCFEIVRISIIS